MHLHGHNFQVLAEGFGDWNGSLAHPHNPQRRDVQLIPGSRGTTINAVDGSVIEPGVPSYGYGASQGNVHCLRIAC